MVHLYVYYSQSLGAWVAQCESMYMRPWTYRARSGTQALTQGLRHLHGHPRDRRTGRLAVCHHGPGDELTATNGRIP